MSVELDHFIVSVRNKEAAAKQLAELLDVPWGPAAVGPFCAVYLNDGLTLDFIDTDGNFPVEHFCFRVSPDAFEQIVARLTKAGIPFRSDVRGPVDRKVGDLYGNVYWNEPDGHQWEVLTKSYARPGAAPRG